MIDEAILRANLALPMHSSANVQPIIGLELSDS